MTPSANGGDDDDRAVSLFIVTIDCFAYGLSSSSRNDGKFSLLLYRNVGDLSLKNVSMF